MRLGISASVGSQPTISEWSAMAAVPDVVANYDAHVVEVISGAVATAYDLSGRSPNAIQSTSTKRPTYSSTGMGTSNGPYWQLDGSDDDLQIADSTNFEFGAGSFAIYVVLRSVGGAGAFRCALGKGADGGGGFRIFRTSSQALALYYSGASSYAASTVTLADGVNAVMMWGVDAANAKVLYAVNGTRERNNITVQTIPTDSNSVGVGVDQTPAYRWNVRMSEIVVVKRSATQGIPDSEVADTISNLRAKWGI